MKSKLVLFMCFFDHRDGYIQGDIRLSELRANGFRSLFGYMFVENTTYEEIIQKEVQLHRLPPLDDPRLRYNLVLQVFKCSYESSGYNVTLDRFSSVSQPVNFREGQTLASTHLTRLVPHEYYHEDVDIPQDKNIIYCAISIEVKAPLSPKEKPSSAPSLVETAITDLTSQEAMAVANFITIATGFAALTGALRLMVKQWSKRHKTDSTSSQERTSQPSETDIVTIRLRMTHGPDHEFEEWLTESERLKHYIDVFNEPSNSIQPLHAIFVQRNGKAIKVDVSKGTQNNLQLNELLGYLNIETE